MKKHTTRHALLTSALSLLLCVSMLVGTTFAWFTDSVTSGQNKIVAGNLDIDVKYDKTPSGAFTTSIDQVEDLFVAPDGAEKGLWEPGHTEVAYLKVENNGTLALKYQFMVQPINEVIGKTADNKDIKLSDILLFAATVPTATAPAAYTRETAQQAAREAKGKLLGYNTDTFTLEAGAAHYIALVVYMPDEVGNEANYRGDAVPTINFALTALATQVEAESDSFGTDYDKTALYADHYVRTNDELTNAIADLKEGEIVALYAGNYTMPMNDTWYKTTALPAGVTFVGAEPGVKLTPVSNGSTEAGEQGRITANNYTFRNLTFTNTVSPSGYGKFIDCVFEGYNGLRHGAYKGDTQFIGCVFNNENGWAFHTEYLYGADVTFEGCSFKGLVEFTDTIAEVNQVFFNNCAFVGTNRTASGKVFYAWKNNAVITDCAGYDASLFAGCTAAGKDKAFATNSAELKAAVDAGEKEILAIGATFDDKLTLGSDVNATFVNCDFSGNNAWRYVNNATFEGCTFDSAETAMHFDQIYGELSVKDCEFVAGKIQLGTNGSASASFENCVFGETVQTSIWSEKGIRVYCPTTFTNCEFNNRVVLAGSNGLAVTFVSCTMNDGQAVYYNDNTDGIIRGGNVPNVTVQ